MKKGSLYTIAGLLLIAAALLLTLWNLWEEQRADRASTQALEELETALDEAQQAFISDKDGNALDWPLDREGGALAWPVDETGRPISKVMDETGRVYSWPEDRPCSDDLWNKDTQGGLLPWLTDGLGTFPWPTDDKGFALSWDRLQGQIDSRREEQKWLKQPAYVRNPNMEMPTEKVDGNYYIGTLQIDVLGLKLPIISEWNYSRLHVAPCRYTGSIYKGDMIIAGHNYRYHFGHLIDLRIGDSVRFTDMDGNVFAYEVVELETLERRDVDRMLSGDWDLTLFTCTYGGRQRVTVRCALVEE